MIGDAGGLGALGGNSAFIGADFARSRSVVSQPGHDMSSPTASSEASNGVLHRGQATRIRGTTTSDVPKRTRFCHAAIPCSYS
jgi:hypothetical protein